MKGRLIRSNGEWKVSYIDSQGTSKLLPLHPYDEQILQVESKQFKDVDGKIPAHLLADYLVFLTDRDIEFGIENFWETGIEEPFETALLIKDESDWDITLNDGLEGL
jgi:hypothetical protein